MLNLSRNNNREQRHINDWVDMGSGFIANRYGILTTSLVCYELWVQTENGMMPPAGEYSSITHHDEYGWMGAYTTRALPPELEALPGWKPGYWPTERIAKVQAYHDELKQVAETYICSAFPQDFEPEDTYPTDAELDAYYRKENPYYQCFRMFRVTGMPDVWCIWQNIYRSAYSWGSIISHTNSLPIFNNREEAIRALAIVTVARAFYGMLNTVKENEHVH